MVSANLGQQYRSEAPPHHADKIFDAFLTTKAHGTGTGLQISCSIVESNGAACGLSITLRAAQGSVSHYPPAERHTTQLCREIALELQMAFTPTTQSFESMNAGRTTQPE